MLALMPFDVWLFYAINHGWSNVVFDYAMPIVTDTAVWRPIYVLGIAALLLRGGRKGQWCAAALLIGVAIADPASHNFLKEPIGRLRPYISLTDVHQLSGSGGGSFPSNHALNNAMAAVLLSWRFPSMAWLWWLVAAAIMVSRIYVGVHWPSDVLAGAVIGAAWGWILLAAMDIVNKRVPPRFRYDAIKAS